MPSPGQPAVLPSPRWWRWRAGSSGTGPGRVPVLGAIPASPPSPGAGTSQPSTCLTFLGWRFYRPVFSPTVTVPVSCQNTRYSCPHCDFSPLEFLHGCTGFLLNVMCRCAQCDTCHHCLSVRQILNMTEFNWTKKQVQKMRNKAQSSCFAVNAVELLCYVIESQTQNRGNRGEIGYLGTGHSSKHSVYSVNLQSTLSLFWKE